MTKDAIKKKLKDEGSRLVYNLTWLSLVWLIVGAMVGMTITMFFTDMHDAAIVLMTQWRREAIIGLCILVLSGRVGTMISRPRNPPLDYTKLTGWGGFWANLVTIAYLIAIFILVFALAPDIFRDLVSLIKEIF